MIRPPASPHRPSPVTSPDLARAARLLAVRSLRDATGLFAGNYASAFRGGGLEFEESRPYVAGDDVRTIDWIATARSGEPFVKRFREERNQNLLFGLDVSASMGFASVGPSKAATAAHAVALLAAAAGRAGDRTGLLVFDANQREAVSPGRGLAHTWSLIRSAVDAAAHPRGQTDLAAAVRSLRVIARRHATVILLSDFREPDGELIAPRLRVELAGLARRCDVVACVLSDPREESLPPSGPMRVFDPEAPGIRHVFGGSQKARGAYRAACEARRSALLRALRRCGVDPIWLRSGGDPLHTLGRFFYERTRRRSRVAS